MTLRLLFANVGVVATKEREKLFCSVHFSLQPLNAKGFKVFYFFGLAWRI